MTSTLPDQAPVCVACLGDTTGPRDRAAVPALPRYGHRPDPLAPTGIEVPA